jgi:anti-repressor protein
MNELIKINYGSERPTVSARDLHELLEVATAYKDWFPRMCEYGFTEGVEFNPLKIEQVQTEGNREVKREIIDHQITLEMAKEICMIQRNEKGSQAQKGSKKEWTWKQLLD